MKTFTAISMLLFFTSLTFSQWIQTSTPEGGGVTDMVVLEDGTIIAAVSSFEWPNGQQGGLRRSTDGGNSWQNINNVYNARTIWIGSTGKLFASYWPYPQNESMYYSTNNGINWVEMYFGSANDNVFSITSKDNDNTVFIGTRFGVWRSVNNGLWQFTSNGIPANTFVFDLDVDPTGTYIAAGTSKGLYVTSNNGANWNAVSGISQTDTIYTVQFVQTPSRSGEDNILFSGTSEGEVFKSSAGGQFLAAILVVTFFGRLGDIEVVGNGEFTLIAAAVAPFFSDNMTGPGFSYSTDMGASWQENIAGLPSNPKTSCIAYRLSGGVAELKLGLFENSNGGAKIFKMSTPIGIHQISNEVPDVFSLSQNYPNPFNPMTKIKFNITKASNVNITVFDVLGKHITTLVNEKLGAGSYETEWNANNMPGGVYFYRIESDDFSETKKMILIK